MPYGIRRQTCQQEHLGQSAVHWPGDRFPSPFESLPLPCVAAKPCCLPTLTTHPYTENRLSQCPGWGTRDKVPRPDSAIGQGARFMRSHALGFNVRASTTKRRMSEGGRIPSLHFRSMLQRGPRTLACRIEEPD